MDDDLDWSSILNGREFSSQTPQHDILKLFLDAPLPSLPIPPGATPQTSASFPPFSSFGFSPEYSTMELSPESLSNLSPTGGGQHDQEGIGGSLWDIWSSGDGQWESGDGSNPKNADAADGAPAESPKGRPKGGGKEEAIRKHSRGSKACVRCRKQKMRCLNNEGESPCQRCIRQRAECIFADISSPPLGVSSATAAPRGKGLKSRKARKSEIEPSHSSPLLVSAGVHAPLSQSFSSPPDETQLSPSSISSSPNIPLSAISESRLDILVQEPETQENNVRITYPESVGANEALVTSRIGRCMDVLSVAQVAELFSEFYHSVNPSWSLLDETWHTPDMVGDRSPLLLLSICTISSRFHKPTQGLYRTLYDIAREDAASVLVEGARTVETVQACLLLAMYAVHPAGTAQDLGWLLICFASRLAADLGLQRPKPASAYTANTPQEADRENRNRIRTWMLCFSLDRSYSLQRGRVASLTCLPAHIIQISTAACEAEPKCVGIAGYMELQAISSEALDTLQWSDGCVDYGTVTGNFEAKVVQWQQKLHGILSSPAAAAHLPAEQLSYFFGIFDFYRDYWCLVVFSFGLQNAVDTNSPEVAYYFFKCAALATTMLKNAHERLALHPYFRQAPDSRFVFLTYAAVTLLKFAQPTFQRYIPAGSDLSIPAISSRVLRLADLLQETAVEGDETHFPAICAEFLRGLVRVIEGVKDEALKDVGGPKVGRLVGEVMEKESWSSMVVPGFDGRERPSTANFLRSGLTTVC